MLSKIKGLFVKKKPVPITELQLDVRITRALFSAGFSFIEDLPTSETELVKIPKVGIVSARRILTQVSEYGRY